MKYFINSLLLLFFLSLNSCFFIGKATTKKYAKNEFTEKFKAIPPEFGSENTILLCILTGEGKYNRYLKKGVEKNYSGKHAFVTYKEMESLRYVDKKKYRYYFSYTEANNRKQLLIYDRLNNITYQSGAGFSFYSVAIKVYMQNLEKKRLSYSNFK